jgi:hypothetical protein
MSLHLPLQAPLTTQPWLGKYTRAMCLVDFSARESCRQFFPDIFGPIGVLIALELLTIGSQDFGDFTSKG